MISYSYSVVVSCDKDGCENSLDFSHENEKSGKWVSQKSLIELVKDKGWGYAPTGVTKCPDCKRTKNGKKKVLTEQQFGALEVIATLKDKCSKYNLDSRAAKALLKRELIELKGNCYSITKKGEEALAKKDSVSEEEVPATSTKSSKKKSSKKKSSSKNSSKKKTVKK